MDFPIEKNICTFQTVIYNCRPALLSEAFVWLSSKNHHDYHYHNAFVVIIIITMMTNIWIKVYLCLKPWATDGLEVISVTAKLFLFIISPTYLPIYLPIYLSTYISTYLLIYPPTYQAIRVMRRHDLAILIMHINPVHFCLNHIWKNHWLVCRCVLQTYAGLWVALHLPPSSPPSWSPHIPHLPILFILNFHVVTLAMMTLDFQWHGQHWLQSGFILHDRWHPMPSILFIQWSSLSSSVLVSSSFSSSYIWVEPR